MTQQYTLQQTESFDTSQVLLCPYSSSVVILPFLKYTSQVRVFANDTAVYFTTSNEGVANILQSDHKTLTTWKNNER